MTNKDKFIEVFGFEPDTETMIPVCPPRGVECPFMDDGIYSECHCELWWGREYKEPKTGEWIEHFDESGKWYECDQCHTDWGGAVNYCPNCGADMRGVEE